MDKYLLFALGSRLTAFLVFPKRPVTVTRWVIALWSWAEPCLRWVERGPEGGGHFAAS